MQVPFKIQVSISFSVITDSLPQKGGQFYSLAKRFDKYGSLVGSDNWLSDSIQQQLNNKMRGGMSEEEAKAVIYEESKDTKTVKGITKLYKDFTNRLAGNTRE